MRIVIPLVLLLAGVGTLITVGILQGGIPEMQVAELFVKEVTAKTRIKVHGKIHEIHSEGRPIRFVMRDKKNPEQLVTVEVDDVRPDLFKVDNDVAVEGFYDRETGNLVGDRIFTKCPSKYEASDEVYQPAVSPTESEPAEAAPVKADETARAERR